MATVIGSNKEEHDRKFMEQRGQINIDNDGKKSEQENIMADTGLDTETYLQQFHNYHHHVQDENYNKPEWYELDQQKPSKPVTAVSNKLSDLA